MALSVFLICSALLVASALVVVRVREGTLQSPGAVLLLIYAIHCFIEPTLRYLGLRVGFPLATWPILSVYNLVCYGALVCGYMLPRLPLRQDKQHYQQQRPSLIFDRVGFVTTVVLVFMIIVWIFAGMAYYGRFEGVKHQFEDYKPVGYELIISTHFILYLFIPALFVAVLLNREKIPGWHKTVVWLLVGLVVLYSLALLDRGIIFTVAFTVALICHFRYRSFTRWQMAGTLLFVAFVVAFTLLRRAGTGIVNIGWGTVTELVATGQLAFIDILVIGLTMFEGQQVLANVIELVDDTGLFYGKTYLNTVLRQMVPFYNADMPIPSLWYRIAEQHAPGSFGRGFGLLAESYMNFGRYGFVVLFCVGLAARYLSFKIYTTRHPIMLIWAAYAIAGLLEGLRRDSYALFTHTFLHILPLLVFWGLLQISRTLSLSRAVQTAPVADR